MFFFPLFCFCENEEKVLNKAPKGTESFKFNKKYDFVPNFFFSDCKNTLKDVSFDNFTYIRYIGESSFENCIQLKEIDLSSLAFLVSIKERAFFNCTNLNSVVFPSNYHLYDIEGASFAFTGLKNIKFPSTICKIKTKDKIGAFYCSNLEKVEFEELENNLDIQKYAFSKTKIEDFQIPSKLSDFCPLSFYLCTKMTKISMKNNENFKIVDNCLFSNDLSSILFVPCGRTKPVILSQETKEIGAYSFVGCRISSVLLNEELEFVRKSAFEESFISMIVFKANTLVIDEEAFLNCYYLEKAVLSSKITKISKSLFKNCIKLSKIDFGNCLEYIGNYSFYNCTMLKAIPNCPNLKEIGLNAFSFTALEHFSFGKKFKKWNIPFKETKIESISLYDGNKHFSIHDNCLYSFNYRILYFVPFGVNEHQIHKETEIVFESAAFKAKIKSIHFQNKLLVINSYAFYECESLTELKLGKSLTTLNNFSFSCCTKLSEISLGSVTYLPSNCFSNCVSLQQIIIPESVETILSESFKKCSNLRRVLIKGKPKLEFGAFIGCRNLQCIHWENGTEKDLTDVGLEPIMLNSCQYFSEEELKDIKPRETEKNSVVEENVKIITKETFSKSFDTLNSLSFKKGSELREISDYSFYKFALLSSVDLSNCLLLKIIGNFAFFSCFALKSVILPEKGSLYSLGVSCFSFTSITKVFIPGSVTLMKGKEEEFGVFESCKKLSSVKFGSNSKLKEFSFRLFSCTNIKSLEITSKITKIEGSAFFCCNRLKNFVISNDNTLFEVFDNSLYSFGKKEIIFCNRNAKGEFLVPKETKIIASSAFSFTKITKIIFQNVEIIGYKAFSHCDKLNSVSVPKSVKEIKANAFEFCSEMNSFSFSASQNKISSFTFKSCSKLRRIFIPTTIKVIENFAFFDCISLSSVEGCFGVKNISEFSFAKTNISSFWFGKDLENVDPNAFSECDNLKNIKIDVRNTKFTVFSNSIYSFDFKKLIFFIPGNIGSLFVKNGTEEICENAAESSLIYEATVPQTVKVIGKKSFANCSLLSEVFLFKGLQIIDEMAFYNCPSLNIINIPEGICSIGLKCFAFCGSLNNVCIPGGIKDIGAEAFYGCKSLTYIKFFGPVDSIGENSFAKTGLKCGIDWPFENIGIIEKCGLNKKVINQCEDK